MKALHDLLLKRHQQHMQARQVPVIAIGDVPWTLYHRMAVPLGPVSFRYSVDPAAARQILAQLPALLIRWTDGLDTLPQSPWYSVICERFVPVDELSSRNARSKLRRGLKRVRVERMDPVPLATALYQVEGLAYQRYSNRSSRARQRSHFVADLEVDGQFSDIIHYWGVFIGDELVGYSRNRIFGTHCAHYDTIHLTPEGLRQYAAYALIHTMNRHYLEQAGFDYVNDGFRTLLHETDFQAFLVSNFGFRLAPHRLRIRYRSWVGLAVRAAFPCRRLLARWDDRLAALLRQEQLRRSCARESAANHSRREHMSS